MDANESLDLKGLLDIEKLLTRVCFSLRCEDPANVLQLIIVPLQPDPRHSEQSINNILMLKNFVETAPKFFDILAGARSELLVEIQKYCNPNNLDDTVQLIKEVINDDVGYQKSPLDLRNQRTYAVKVSYFSAGGPHWLTDYSLVLAGSSMWLVRHSRKQPRMFINMLQRSTVRFVYYPKFKLANAIQRHMK
jgi:hypothetical protein